MPAPIIPVSKTNVRTVIDLLDPAATPPFSALKGVPKGKWIAYDSNGYSRQQTLEKNVELRGTRQMGTRVVGPKNPAGPLKGHMTDGTLPLMWYRALGKIVSTVKPPAVVTAAMASPAAAGSIDNGTHSYKIVYTKVAPAAVGATLPSAASLTVNVVDKTTNGKITVTMPSLPTGWTKDLYRSSAGDVAPWKKVNTVAIGAAVTTYLDNIADASLGASAPTTGVADDWTHVITIGDSLPGAIVERKIVFPDGSGTRYERAFGAYVNKAMIDIKGTGFYDFTGDDLCFYVSDKDPDTLAAFTEYDAAPTDWKGGEKLHHAMVLSGQCLVDGVAFAKFLNCTISHANNLDVTDFPVSEQGNRGSLVGMQAETTLTATMKVTDAGVYAITQDGGYHTFSIRHDFAGFGHYSLMEVLGFQSDPNDAPVIGQGILTLPLNAQAFQPLASEQLRVTIVNDHPDTDYQ